MTITRRDFIELSKILSKLIVSIERGNNDVSSISLEQELENKLDNCGIFNYFYRSNPRFDKHKFLSAITKEYNNQ